MSLTDTWHQLAARHPGTLADPKARRAAASAATRGRHDTLAAQTLSAVADAGGDPAVTESLSWAIDTHPGAWLGAATGDEPSYPRAWRAARSVAARTTAAARTSCEATQRRLAEDAHQRRRADLRQSLLANPRLRPAAAALLADGLCDDDFVPAGPVPLPLPSGGETLAAILDACDAATFRMLLGRLPDRAYSTPVADAVVDGVGSGRLADDTDATDGGWLPYAVSRLLGDVVLRRARPETVARLHAAYFEHGDDVDPALERDLAAFAELVSLPDAPRTADRRTVGATLVYALLPREVGPVQPPDSPLLDAIATHPRLDARGAATLLRRTLDPVSEEGARRAAGVLDRFHVADLLAVDAAVGGVLWDLRDANPGPPSWWPAGGDAALGAWMAAQLDGVAHHREAFNQFAANHAHDLPRPDDGDGRVDVRLRAATLAKVSAATLAALPTAGAIHDRVADLIARVLARIDAAGADAVALAGDYADATVDEIFATAAAMPSWTATRRRDPVR